MVLNATLREVGPHAIINISHNSAGRRHLMPRILRFHALFSSIFYRLPAVLINPQSVFTMLVVKFRFF